MWKSQSDCKIFGVCGGLAEQFGLNSTVLRLAFACAFIFFGAGLLVYLILALVMR